MKRKNGVDIDGWLIIDKPRDMGSTNVVSISRRFFNANKNGHTGTLDPFATGVLPIAFGEATKLIPFVTDGKKEYEFTLQFGAESTTEDSEGEIKKIRDARHVTSGDILGVLPRFMGEIVQIPSQYSAIKINGKRAYDLARQGEVVEMPSRKVSIYSLELLEMLPNNCARLKVECSKGTYVRSLGKDIAAALGTKGYLRELRRTRCGNFSIEDAVLLEKIGDDSLLPMGACLFDVEIISVSEPDVAKLRLGQGISPREYNAQLGEAVAVFNEKLVAIVRVEEKRISPVRVFAERFTQP